MAETTSVTFHVLGVQSVAGRGRTRAYAAAVIEIQGVEIAIHGISVVEQPNSTLACEAPKYRHIDGRWLPCIGLPPELRDAIAREVIEAMQDNAQTPRK